MRAGRGRALAVGWSAALVAILVFVSLGTWQLGRQQHKQALLDASTRVLQARAAVPLESAADVARQREYDWSAGAGRFADAPAILLDNQQRHGRAGVRVYRAFLPDASDAVPVLVELGWVPMPPNRQLAAIGAAPAWADVQGLLAPPPAAGLAAPAIQPQPDGSLMLLALDTGAVREALGLPALAPRVLRADPELQGGYPRDLEILANTLPPERHLGYAVQWYGFAAVTLAIALILTLRRPRRRSAS